MANYNTVTLEQIEDAYTRVLETPNVPFTVESSRGHACIVERLAWVSDIDGESREYVRVYNSHSNAGFTIEEFTFENFALEVASKTNARLKWGKEVA